MKPTPITTARAHDNAIQTFKSLQALGGAMQQKYSLQGAPTQRYSLGDDTPRYSPYQNFLYQRALYGLKIYTAEELRLMNKEKRKRIERVHKRTQNILNLWKQTKLIDFGKAIFGMFHNSTLAHDIMATYNEPDPNFLCAVSFRELGINKEDVINKLLQNGLLPKNFYTLDNEATTKTL